MIEAVAEQWWQEGKRGTVLESDWPPELKRFGAESVYIRSDGVYIVIGSRFVEQWGLFVLPSGSEFQPSSNSDPAYTPIRGRLFRYSVKG